MISGINGIDNGSLLMIPEIADDIGNDVAVGTNRELREELIIPKSDYSPHRSSTQHRRGTLRVQSMFLLPP
jgi:hypothetical protein